MSVSFSQHKNSHSSIITVIASKNKGDFSVAKRTYFKADKKCFHIPPSALLSIFVFFFAAEPSDGSKCASIKGKIPLLEFSPIFSECVSAKWKFSFFCCRSHANMCNRGKWCFGDRSRGWEGRHTRKSDPFSYADFSFRLSFDNFHHRKS